MRYALHGKAARGLVPRSVAKMTVLSRAQQTRLTARNRESGRGQPFVYHRRSFAQRDTRANIELLASVDEAHDTLSGPATRCDLEREVERFGKQEYGRLATISIAHLYNLRGSQRYRERRLNNIKTRRTKVSIGDRRKSEPQGRHGFLRVDTVHRGDQPGAAREGRVCTTSMPSMSSRNRRWPRQCRASWRPIWRLYWRRRRQFPFRT